MGASNKVCIAQATRTPQDQQEHATYHRDLLLNTLPEFILKQLL
jgi:hypothetical protein